MGEEGYDGLNIFGDAESDSDCGDNVEMKWDTYSLKSKNLELRLALVKRHHSLWAEYIYNAARVLADLIDSKIVNCLGKLCLELGAGAGLPGVVAALSGATTSVISDYGSASDTSLLKAIEINVGQTKAMLDSQGDFCNMYAAPYIFGASVDTLLNLTNGIKFDRIFLADLLFNRSEHQRLLWTIKNAMSTAGGAEAWVTFSHHDPQKRLLDLRFFELAMQPEVGLLVTFLGSQQRKSYPFVEYDGMDEQRGVVYIYKLTLAT